MRLLWTGSDDLCRNPGDEDLKDLWVESHAVFEIFAVVLTNDTCPRIQSGGRDRVFRIRIVSGIELFQ